MKQIKKNIYALFFVLLIALSGATQAADTACAEPQGEVEVLLEEALAQKPAKQRVAWYKRTTFWRDVAIVGSLIGIYLYNYNVLR